jgi:hypothetical protein
MTALACATKVEASPELGLPATILVEGSTVKELPLPFMSKHQTV